MNEKRKRKHKGTKPKLRKGIIFLSLVIVCIFGASLWLVDVFSASGVAYSFMGHIYSERHDSAFELFTQPLQEQGISARYLQVLVHENDARPESWWIDTNSNSDRSGKYTGRVTLEDGNTVALTLQLKTEDGEWRVAYFQWGRVSSKNL